MKWSEIEIWLDYLSYFSGEDSIKEFVKDKINNHRNFHDITYEETPLCRHCLIKMSLLGSDSDQLKEILKIYEFDGAIIC